MDGMRQTTPAGNGETTSGPSLVTFGHGTADAGTMTRLLHGAGIRRLVDVRTAPGSRRNPDASRAAMTDWLSRAGVDYRWDRRLGGWRKASPASPDVALRNESFRGYAEHMRTAEFRAAVEELRADVEADPTAVLCAESVWWRCHRKLIADFLVLVHGIAVHHLMHDGSLRPHSPSPAARLIPDERVLIYDEDGSSRGSGHSG
ncbi:Protein of unknown function, DUF488 [Saccharomonospora viridis]|jgi:uncharacterized protein (DUF488 family)|nr:hypothetical protein MINT15_02950 [Saccharomonospora viridis]SFP37914.1 Protein of unknown function, DUF488 [Saccharomonospora viridis]